MINIHELLSESYIKWPEKVAIRNAKGNREYTYKQLFIKSLCVKNQLEKMDIHKRSHIGISINNNLEFVTAFFGILMADMVVIPIPFPQTEEDQKNLKNLSVQYIIDEDFFKLIREEDKDNDDILISQVENLNNNRSSKELALLFNTSGTTSSRSKVVMLSHQNIISNAIAHGEMANLKESKEYLITMPLFFSATITTQLLACIAFGVTLTLLTYPIHPKVFYNTIDRINIDTVAMVPTMLRHITKYYRLANLINGQLKNVFIGAAPLTETDIKNAKGIFPNASIFQTYGLTEASPRVSMMTKQCDKLSCGKPIKDVEIRIADDYGNPVLTNQHGEIMVKGPNVMLGYYNDAELTSSTIVDGWLKTGDIGFIDHEGNLHLVGRKKNIIIVGGINVCPEEVEGFLHKLEGVDEVLVEGRCDPLLGEVPVAYIKLSSPTIITKEDIINSCLGKMSSYKIPKEIIFVNQFEKTGVGKIKRNQQTFKT